MRFVARCVLIGVWLQASAQAQSAPLDAEPANPLAATDPGAFESAEPLATCPRTHVADCPEATRTLNALVEAQCLAPGPEPLAAGSNEALALVEVLEGSCELPEAVELRFRGQVLRWTLEEPEITRWRFVALAIVESLRPEPPEAAAAAVAVPDRAAESEDSAAAWVDPRPLATQADIERWLPSSGGLVDTGRGSTAIALQLGVAGASGVVGLAALSVRHRFDAPWTLGVEAYPVLFARLDGEPLGAVFGALRGGYDAAYGSVELSLGLAPSRGLRPSSVAPTAGLQLRIGVDDGVALRAAFELLYSSGTVRVHRAMLRLQGLIFRRWRLFSQLDAFFASGLYSAQVGFDYWLVGRGESGSWSIGADIGTSFVLYVPQCEFGDCTAVGVSDESFIGPSVRVRLEVRL